MVEHMNIPRVLIKREQSSGEELANSLSHGIGLVAALVATPFVIQHATQQGNVRSIVGVSIFTATMVLLYFSSAVYHALPTGKAKRVFQIIEHSAIYLLIAGTYTPFTLGVLNGAWGWLLLGIIWGLAATGIILKVSGRMSRPIISTGLYLLMGWLIVIAVNPMYERIPSAGLLLLAGGGAAYTAGVAFYVADARLRYGHFIWHLFVMAGTVCHYFAVLWYSA